MKAIVYRKYGSPDVLSFEEVDRPIPKDVKFSMSDKMICQDLRGCRTTRAMNCSPSGIMTPEAINYLDGTTTPSIDSPRAQVPLRAQSDIL